MQRELKAEKGRSESLEVRLNQEKLSITLLKSQLQEMTTKNTELESRLAESLNEVCLLTKMSTKAKI